MKAFAIKSYGKSVPLSLVDLPEADLGPRDARVCIQAAGVNALDSKVRNGEFKAFLPYKMPLILGNDMAGVITKIGSAVRRFTVGDVVYARPADDRIGTFAENIVIAEDDLAHVPKNITIPEAASLPLVALTAWQALVEVGQVGPGQKVLVHAGSGGVGTVAIQLAKHLGAQVATTCSARNIAMMRDLGADVVIDYATQDFAAELSGYDLVLNSLDGDTLLKSVGVLRPGGRLISISGPPDLAFAAQRGLNFGLKAVFAALSFKIRRAARKAGVTYGFLYMRSSGEQLAKVTALVEQGLIRPVIDRIFPFRDTVQALAYLEQGHAKGKVVIVME